MTPPSDPVAAATHADPYPYYAELVARRAFARDERLGLWVAAGADAVTAVLAHPACRVRPAAEPVPAAIAGTAAGDIFGAMVRFNDGARHGPLKAAVGTVVEALDPPRLRTLSRETARALARELRPQDDPSALDAYARRLAPSVIGALLGAPAAALADVARSAGEFVAATTPGATSDVVARGAAAATELQALGHTLIAGDGLVAALARRAPAGDQDRVVANALGFLWQAYDATAALVGNTLLALARTPALHDAKDMLPITVEVARHDAPVQNTRRFVEGDARVAGVDVKRGETILVLLAAANRDPAANPEPARFDAARTTPRTFTFGHGPHACPGAIVATTIASAGVEALLAAGVEPVARAAGARYRPSANIRLPLFGSA